MIQRLSIRIPVIIVPIGRNRVPSSMVQCGQLATTYLWYILLWKAKSKQQREMRCIIRVQLPKFFC